MVCGPNGYPHGGPFTDGTATAPVAMIVAMIMLCVRPCRQATGQVHIPAAAKGPLNSVCKHRGLCKPDAH